MRRLAFIVTFLVGTAGIFQWLSRGFSTSWEPSLRAYLEETTGRLTQTQVHIDSIAPSFFHRIRLVNVRVSEPRDPEHPLFQAAEIELTLSVIDLPRAILHRHPYDAIGLVSLKNPWIRLSPDILERHTSHRAEKSSLPPWFTLAWEGGTFQWVDARAPHGTWTLYQAQGAYRIRGPQMNFAIRGSALEAPSVRFQFSSLAHRWNAQFFISEANSQSVLEAARAITRRPLLPLEWSVRGGFDFNAQASGRSWPMKGEDWTVFLNQAELTFIPVAATPEKSSIGMAGKLLYKKGKITASHWSFDTPWVEGTGQAELLLQGTRARPEVTLNAELPTGRVGKEPFQDAKIQARYVDEHWEILPSTLRFLDGHVSAKGFLAAAGSDLSITADNVSLASLGQAHGIQFPEGRLNVSCALKGPREDWQTAGAWWLSGVQWGASPAADARGDFEITPTHFQAQAKSDNSRFRFALEGNRSGKILEVDRFELYLPSGASLTGEGHENLGSRQIQGTWDASRVAFPSDLPFLPVTHIPMKALIDGHVKLSGTTTDPMFKGTLQSSDFSVQDQLLGKASLSFAGDKTHWEIPALHIDPGIDGHYVNGQGLFKIQNTPIGKWKVTQGLLRFEHKADAFRVEEFSLQMPQATLRANAKAIWVNESTPQRLMIEGHGELGATSDPGDWDIPFDLKGQLESSDTGWKGIAHVLATHPLLRKKSTEPVEATIHWNSQELTWSDTHWGKHWLSKGSLHWNKQVSEWSASLQATQVQLSDWQPLLFPNVKDEWRGILNGTLALSGTAEHPLGDLSFQVDEGRWRAFQFTTEGHGTWSREGIKPLTVKGHFKSGGNFLFSGLLSPEGQAQGSVKLDGFNLRPLGESLHFPKPLEGLTTATLTLSGPLAHLKWNGHLEGGPLVYAPTGEHPFKLEQFSTDMTLAPLESDPAISHLTLTEGQAKTSEELIRFRPGSFVEFAGTGPARLSLGTEIRNLHLGIFTLFGGLDVDGTWQIKPQGFAITAKAQTHSLFINDYELEEGLILADYYNSILKFTAAPHTPALVTGTINFQNAPQLKFTEFYISGKDGQGLQLSGDIGPQLWDFQMVGHGLDMGTLGELSGFPYTLSGAADVQVHGTGDPTHPHVDGKVDLDHGSVMGLAFRSGSAAFIWQGTRITFTKLFLSDPGHYNLEGAGAFPLVPKHQALAQDRSIDFSVRLRDSNLSLLQSFSREVKSAKGPVEGLLQIKGTVEDPDLHGSVRVSNGEILGAHYFRQLRGASLALDFDGDTVYVRELKGKSGDGEFHGSGSVTLSGFQPSKYDLQLAIVSSKGLDVQVPELAIPESPLAKRLKFLTTISRADLRGHVALHGPAEAPVFSGEGIISNGHFTFPPSHKNPSSQAILEWFRRITWDVNLKFQDGAWFENELVQANLVGSLALKGPSDKLRVDGGLEITEGKISYLGLQFDIQQARFDLRSETTGDTVVNTPYVRGVAECQTQAVDTVSGVAGSSGGGRLNINDTITLNIDYAPIDQIKPRLTSAANPTLSQEKVLARATGTDIQNLTPQERNSLYQKQVVSMIDSSLTTPLAQNVLKKTGLADRLRVEQVIDANSITGQDLNTTAAQQQSTGVNLFANKKYTVEKDLSNRLSLGYGVRFIPTAVVDAADVQQQKLDLVSDLQLSYRWFRNIYLRGDFDLPTSNPSILPERKVTIEPRWRFGWWGNTNKDKEKPKSTP